MSTNNAVKRSQVQEIALPSERKSFFTLFHSPSSTGYSGATTSVNWMKQKFTFPSDRIQNIDTENMAEHQIECSPTAQFQTQIGFQNSQLQRANSFREIPKTQNYINAQKRPLTREQEYQLYPALKYRDYASKNTYIKFTNYRTSSITNLNKDQKELLDFQPKSANNRQLNLDDLLEAQNQMEINTDNSSQKIYVKNQKGTSQIIKNEKTAFSTEKKKKPNKNQGKQSKSKSNLQSTINRSNSTNCFTLDIQKPFFIASRAQINSQQKQFQTDQVSFIPDPQNSEGGNQIQQTQIQNDIKSQLNESQKQKYFISRTRFRNTDEKLVGTYKTNTSQSQNLFDLKQVSQQVPQKNFNTNQSEQILTDVDIRLMMISAGIDPLKDYLSRRANFGCKSIYNPDLLNHFERISSKNRYYSQQNPSSDNEKKYQTQKDVEEYYHHLERFDKEGNDEYFIQTRKNATNYNRFHMSKPNIRMRYEQQLKIANYLITKAQEEKQNNIQKYISAPPIQQIISDSENETKQNTENNLVHGLHKYLLAKDLIKETWKQLQQPETPNPNKIVQMLNNNTVSSQSFSALLKEKNFIKNQISAKSSQPVSMKSIDFDDTKINQLKQNENPSNQQEKLESQFKFQQFIIDQGLQEMNHYDEIVRWYKQRFSELNQQGKEGRNNQNTEKLSQGNSAQKSKSKSRSQSPKNQNLQLKDCNINSQQTNLPTELNVYTREDIFIKKTIDKMINSDEIDIVSLSDIAQLQKIIYQRQTILQDLKQIIIKSVNEILAAKLKKTKKKNKSNSQEFSEQFNKQNSTLDRQSKQQLHRSYSSQKLSNQSKSIRVSTTQQAERKKKYKQQNSLGYQDYVQSKMEKEFFSKLKKKTKKGESSTFITDHPQQEDTKKLLQNKNVFKDSMKQNKLEVTDDVDSKKEKVNQIDLKQLKTQTLQSQESITPLQKNASLSQSTPLNTQGFKNITKILDEESQNDFFELNQQAKQENFNNDNQEQQQQSISLTKIKSHLLELTNSKQQKQIIDSHDKQQKQIVDSFDNQQKQMDNSLDKQQKSVVDSFEGDKNKDIKISQSIQSEPKQSQKSQQSNTQNDSIPAIDSINSIKEAEDQIVYDESMEKNISLSQVSEKSQQSDVIIPSFSIFRQESPIKQHEPINNIISLSQQKIRFKNSYDYIQPLIEDLDENESPINQVNLKKNQTFEIQLAQQNSQSTQKSIIMLNEERISLSKFNPLYAQKDSMTDLQQSDEQSKKNKIPSIMISDSLVQIRNNSIVDDSFKLNQEDKFSEYSSLSQAEVKRNREVKQSQQILMDALKQADIGQQRVNTPSLLELPKSKNYITLSANKDSPQLNSQRSNQSSRSNLDSPQLSAVPDTQRSIQSKTEYEKEKLSQLMTQQQRLNKKKAIKSSQRMHSDASKVLNLQQAKLAMAQQFNAQQEFNHLETQSINTRNEKITEFFEMADKVIATKATLNKPGGYNPFFNEEQAEKMIEKLNKSRNRIDSNENELISNLKERVATLEDENTNLKNLLNEKENREQTQFDQEQNQTEIYGKDQNSSNIKNDTEVSSHEEKNNQNEAIQSIKQQVRFDVQNENESDEQDQKQKNKKQELDQSQLYSGDLSIGLEQESSVFASDLKSQSQISLTRLQSQTNLKDESKKKFLQKKNSINTNNNKQKSRPTLVKTNTQNEFKNKEGQKLRQSNSIISTLQHQKSMSSYPYQQQPSLSYLDENPSINKILTQHNLSDIQKLVDQKFQNKKSIAQGFSAASLFQIVSESFVELEEQANIMKEQDSNIFSFKKSVSNLKSSQRLIKAKSFKNTAQRGALKQSAINEILNEYRINDKMSLIEKRKVIQKLVDKLEQRADIEEDQNFNLILYKQVQQEMQFISLRESCEPEQILEQKPNLQQDLSLLDQVDKNKRDFMRARLKFSDNLILNQKNNILQEVNEEDLDIDNEFMDVIQRLVKQNEDLEEEIIRKKIFQDQTIIIQRAIQTNQNLAPVVEDIQQIALQQSLIQLKQNKKKNLQNNVHTFMRQPTKFYSPSKKMSKQEQEVFNKMQKLQEKFQKALNMMSKEEKKELKNVYLNIKYRAESR
ncbi:hypothetical protein TTHERM_00218900 (macronuclear) [Tetrahymena thermophila SB210]|uniref:Uncharacterized protein n=1 Tax=Tetrahymena thermophila (strain SB210) TaxID=312017 RepID=I7M8Z0_TETTS|nr:hypothetical protein TTHERM_00218900 [Tetrahymena thermophila SB210]EAS00317.2 hypothetical protein TTHERM_00218900 [Tetrahymena thermophila SB210]|eukprot:XP_001020562.2 hypothetical protein TTHERM_00218900 [Tetrahymena thermophila SB210]